MRFDPNVEANKEDFLNMANRPMCFDPNVYADKVAASMLQGFLNICMYDMCFDPYSDANKEDFLTWLTGPRASI
jgi:hypothetical protein